MKPAVWTCSRREWLALSSAVVLSACSGSKSTEAPVPRIMSSVKHPNIIVILCDSLRADHLGCYGGRRPNSSHLDQFAAESLVFEQCCSAASWTKPAIASVFTGVLPRVHQAVSSVWDQAAYKKVPVQMLRERFQTLAEGMKSAGYTTAWFLANPQVAGELGFRQGFDHYTLHAGQPAPKQMDKVIQWLSTAPPEPYFLFVHMVNPHEPYQPSEAEYQAVFGRSIQQDIDALPEADRQELKEYHTYNRYKPDAPNRERPPFTNLSPAGIEYIQRLYDAVIYKIDTQFKRLLDHLRQQNSYDRTALVFTSDHGESFKEHDFFYHGNCLYDQEIRIPLIMRLPGMTAGCRIPHTVSQCDLYPTLATLGGFTPPEYLQGRSLISAEGALQVMEDRAVFAELDHYNENPDTWAMALIKGPKKLILHRDTGAKQLFDRYADPSETHDLWNPSLRNDPAIMGLLNEAIEQEKQNRRLAESFGPPEWTPIEQERREELEALGYL